MIHKVIQTPTLIQWLVSDSIRFSIGGQNYTTGVCIPNDHIATFTLASVVGYTTFIYCAHW